MLLRNHGVSSHWSVCCQPPPALHRCQARSTPPLSVSDAGMQVPIVSEGLRNERMLVAQLRGIPEAFGVQPGAWAFLSTLSLFGACDRKVGTLPSQLACWRAWYLPVTFDVTWYLSP